MGPVFAILGGLVALVFVAAATSKLRAPARFAEELADYHVLHPALLRPAAAMLPIIELAVAFAYFVPASRRNASWAMALLLVVFSWAVILNLRGGRQNIRCACFGREDQLLGWSTLVRNTLLLIGVLGSALAGGTFNDAANAPALAAGMLAVAIGTLTLAGAEAIEISRRVPDE